MFGPHTLIYTEVPKIVSVMIQDIFFHCTSEQLKCVVGSKEEAFILVPSVFSDHFLSIAASRHAEPESHLNTTSLPAPSHLALTPDEQSR